MMQYSSAVPFSGDIPKVLDTAIASLTPLGFRITRRLRIRTEKALETVLHNAALAAGG